MYRWLKSIGHPQQSITVFSSELSFPFGGLQILLMLCLPSIGWLAYLLNQLDPKTTKNTFLTSVMLLSVAIAIPLLFVDPDELTLVVTASVGEIGTWMLYSALVSSCVTWIFLVCYFIFQLKHEINIGTRCTNRYASAKSIFINLLP